MALIDNIENLPTGVKVAAGIGAVAGITVFLLNSHNKKAGQSADKNTAQQAATAPPTYQLPQGSVSGFIGSGGSGTVTTPSPTPSPVSSPTAPPSSSNGGGDVPEPGRGRGPTNPPIILPPSPVNTPLPNPAPGAGGGSSQSPGTLPWSPPPGSTIGPGIPALPTPTPTNPSLPMPTPTPSPPVPAPAPISAPVGDTRGVSSLKLPTWSQETQWGSVQQNLAHFFGGNNYKPYSKYENGQWVSFGRMEAGWTDENTGLVLPVAYNGQHDTFLADYSSHPRSESSYSRWGRFTADLLTAHQNLTLQEAGLISLSHMKRDAQATGANLYDQGFDWGSVPDNYGRGTYW